MGVRIKWTFWTRLFEINYNISFYFVYSCLLLVLARLHRRRKDRYCVVTVYLFIYICFTLYS
jgi:hypothetical protein